MASNLDTFTSFVNMEMPKRISTEADATKVEQGLIPRTTGIGLGVEFVNPDIFGQPGKSAYEVAVEAGFVGTVEEWLISLKAEITLTDLKVGIVTHHALPILPNGTVVLPQKAYGGAFLDMALVHLNDGSSIEVIGVTVDGSTLSFIPEDFALIESIAESVSVSYLGDLLDT